MFDLAALDLHTRKHLSPDWGRCKQSYRFQRKSLDVRVFLKISVGFQHTFNHALMPPFWSGPNSPIESFRKSSILADLRMCFPILFFPPCPSLRFRQRCVCYWFLSRNHFENPMSWSCSAVLGAGAFRSPGCPSIQRTWRHEDSWGTPPLKPSIGISTCMDLKSMQQPTTFAFSLRKVYTTTRISESVVFL